MNLPGLSLRNLLYHWRGNLAVLLGMAVGTAVLTGALLVGDSLRGSLAALSNDRLAWIDQALIAPRFFRAELADKDKLGADRASGIIVLRGSASLEGNILDRGSHRVTILGVDESFWPDAATPPDFARPGGQELTTLFLNAAVARALHIEKGGKIALHIPKVSNLPRESLLGRRGTSDVISEVTLDVTGILDAHHPVANFSLQPGAEPPHNVFVPLAWLQNQLGQPGMVNTLLVRGASLSLQLNLQHALMLGDWGLVLRNSNRGYVTLESQQLVLPDGIAQTAMETAESARMRSAPTLAYLANSISEGKESIPYSIVAALDPAMPPPLGPFLPKGVTSLADDEIILAEWKESPLAAKPGDEIALTYFAPEESSEPRELTATLRLRGTVPLEGVADDPNLTPPFPGITDRLTLDKWEPPFPFTRERVQKRDEDYWKQHRATPKAYVTLNKGKELWGSRFGNLTSIRLAPDETHDLDLPTVAKGYEQMLLNSLKAEQGGFVFRNVRQEGLNASAASGTNFGMLFLGFSSFLILAALMLVGLLFHLNLDRRAAEVGLLLASGYRRWTLFFLLLGEGALLAVIGGFAGCTVGAAYAWALLEYFRSLWPGLGDASFLHLHVTLESLGIGFGASVLLGVLTLAWALRGLSRVAATALLAGATAAAETTATHKRRRWSLWIGTVAAIGAALLTGSGFFVKESETQAGTFFSSGILLLTACLAFLWAWMRRVREGSLQSDASRLNLAGLSVRNGTRNPLRSLLTAGLLASAAFLLVAVELFRREPETNYLQKDSGSGGCALVGESETPIYADLNEKRGRNEPLLEWERQLAERPLGIGQIHDKLEQAQQLLSGIEFFAFRLRSGDDTSCLNLYEPRAQQVRLFGVPERLIQRGGFSFADSTAKTPDQQKNPWLLLDEPLGESDGKKVIPVVGERNSLEWVLKKKIGDAVEVPNEKGDTIKLRVVGYLQDSVFQSGLLMSEANFREQFRSEEGYRFFLIDTKDEPVDEVRALLGTVLKPQGFESELSAQRLQSYLAVENMYLTTFQALGALGLLLGAVGLAVVLLRGVWERRGELALLRALGYRHRVLGWLLLLENGFLLIVGLGSGIVAAVLAVAPHLISGLSGLPWLRLALMLGLVLVVGIGSAAAALGATLRTPLLPALRRD